MYVKRGRATQIEALLLCVRSSATAIVLLQMRYRLPCVRKGVYARTYAVRMENGCGVTLEYPLPSTLYPLPCSCYPVHTLSPGTPTPSNISQSLFLTSAGLPPFPAATICRSRMCVRGAPARFAESMLLPPSSLTPCPPYYLYGLGRKGVLQSRYLVRIIGRSREPKVFR